jgi:two-component system response regulator NreC
MSTRILIADDHGIMRAGLRLQLQQIPGVEVVGEAPDGRVAVQLAAALFPHVVIMDIAMPNLNGIDATVQILKSFPAVAVIILSMHSDEEYILRALSAGAKGYLLKETAETDLAAAVRAVAAGRNFFSPAIRAALSDEYVHELRRRGLQDSYDLLTDREKEVLQLLAEGNSNKEVASALDCSVNTVATHRMHIMQKLELHSAADIVLYAVRKRIIS